MSMIFSLIEDDMFSIIFNIKMKLGKVVRQLLDLYANQNQLKYL